MMTFIRYIEVYFYVCVCGLPLLLNEDFKGGSVPYIYCSFGRAEENRSLYRGLRYIEVR